MRISALLICGVYLLLSPVVQARMSEQNVTVPQSGSSEHRDRVIQLPGFRLDNVIDYFYKAVDRRELQVFGIVVDKTMITPVRVEFIFQIGDVDPRIEIYSELRQPIPIPKVEQLCIHGITAVMDLNGNIVDSVAHCGQ